MSPRGRPRAFDRETALREAMYVFWRRGYEGASIGDLTGAMGINPPSLYAAFGCKEALFREAVELYGRTHGGLTGKALAEEPTARASIERMLRDNARGFTSPDLPSGCMVVHAATNFAVANQGLHDFLVEQRRGNHGSILDRIRRGQSEGDLPVEADADAMTLFYETVLYGLSVQARDGVTGDSLKSVVDSAMLAWDTFARGRK
ncbi:TetR/AcrR family transcriptional regulator [Amycolatopsis magusensis]|uniref:TetR/AcrR family transcriptional regulator n=1 Tax=Amycolatopsis magusensis TaxID=882444 RepID=UPI003C2F856C